MSKLLDSVDKYEGFCVTYDLSNFSVLNLKLAARDGDLSLERFEESLEHFFFDFECVAKSSVAVEWAQLFLEGALRGGGYCSLSWSSELDSFFASQKKARELRNIPLGKSKGF